MGGWRKFKEYPEREGGENLRSIQKGSWRKFKEYPERRLENFYECPERRLEGHWQV